MGLIMNDNDLVEKNGIKIENAKVKYMLKKILLLETINVKTKQYNDGQMVNQIKKIIEEEVQCYSNR